MPPNSAGRGLIMGYTAAYQTRSLTRSLSFCNTAYRPNRLANRLRVMILFCFGRMIMLYFTLFPSFQGYPVQHRTKKHCAARDVSREVTREKGHGAQPR